MRVMGGDIGGTRTRLCVMESSHGGWQEVFTREYRSGEFANLQTVVQRCLQESHADTTPIDAACFAVAGPVEGESIRVTNLPWVLTQTALQDELHIPHVNLLNDFSAIGYGLKALRPSDLITLQLGHSESSGVSAIIGAGTGLGMGVVVEQGETTKILPSEGGHADFAPVDDWQVELWHWLKARQKRVSNEDLLSGRGLVLLYEFVCARTGVPPVLLTNPSHGDVAATISERALAGENAQAEEAVKQFVSIYGAVSGNLALLVQPRMGLYIAGGIAAKLGRFMQTGRFIQTFLDKPPMTELLQQIPVQLINDSHIGLKGAVAAACQLMHEGMA